MADVELVIKIDESLYKELFADGEKILYIGGIRRGKTLLATLVRTVRNGKPLSATLGHARPRSECEHDHEILKAYSDGFNNAVDTIRDEIQSNRDEWIKGEDPEWHTYDRCLYIIDKYKN